MRSVMQGMSGSEFALKNSERILIDNVTNGGKYDLSSYRMAMLFLTSSQCWIIFVKENIVLLLNEDSQTVAFCTPNSSGVYESYWNGSVSASWTPKTKILQTMSQRYLIVFYG